MNAVLATEADYGVGAQDSGDWGVMPGPCTDYTIPVTNRSAPILDYWFNCNNPANNVHVNAHWGATRVAVHAITGDAKTWQPRDTFAWIADGTSNQMILAEKHLHSSVIGECSRDEAGNTEPKGGTGNLYLTDCSYFGYASSRLASTGATVRRRSGTNPVTGSGTWYGDDGNPANWYIAAIYRANDREGVNFNNGGTQAGSGFGSYHPGICQFLFADGSVHPLPITLPPRFLGILTDVSDGNSVPTDMLF